MTNTTTTITTTSAAAGTLSISTSSAATTFGGTNTSPSSTSSSTPLLSSSNRKHKNSTKSYTKIPMIKPPVVYKISLFIMIIGKIFIWPNAKVICNSYRISLLLGIPIFILSVMFAMSAKRIFKETSTPMMGGPNKTSPLHLVGIYAITRNPMYLGISIALFGMTLITNCIWHLIFPILNILIMNFYYIPIEEKQLEIKFGNDYIKYKQRVPRWIFY